MFSPEQNLKACRRYEARLEEYLEGRLPEARLAEVESHLERCGCCRAALQAARSSRDLIDRAIEPAVEPDERFPRRVMAAVRAEEERRRIGSEFWSPVEFLAWRLSWSAMLALAILAAYLLGFQLGARRDGPATARPVEAQDIFQESAPHPASQDEVLLAVAAPGEKDSRGK